MLFENFHKIIQTIMIVSAFAGSIWLAHYLSSKNGISWGGKIGELMKAPTQIKFNAATLSFTVIIILIALILWGLFMLLMPDDSRI